MTSAGLAVQAAALAAGCSKAEARLLGAYVVSTGIKGAAQRLGIAEQTALNQSVALKRRLGVGHLAAAVAQVLTYDYVLVHAQRRTRVLFGDKI